MSGAFGWIRNDDGGDGGRSTRAAASGFRDAVTGYQPQPSARSVPRKRATPPPDPPRNLGTFAAAARRGSTPTARHELRSTAANVLIVIQDVTGSMGDKPGEIFRRLPRLWHDAAKYLGTDDLEILFIAHGDARTDTHAVQVARFGRGPELDEHLASFTIDGGGGGQGTESHELVAYYLLTRVDTSTARNVYAFFITDEAACDTIAKNLVTQELGVTRQPEHANTRTVFDALRTRMHVYAVLFPPESYDPVPIREWWEKTLGREGILPLDDPRRIVDVLLGTLAAATGQTDAFADDLRSRQMPTQHGQQNVATVMQSIALVGRGTPSSPHVLPKGGGTRPLLTSGTANTPSRKR
ncbi:MAG: hypothetical protein Q8R16_05495 [bacterium]|nr:hypothetical protein [bacterium]